MCLSSFYAEYDLQGKDLRIWDCDALMVISTIILTVRAFSVYLHFSFLTMIVTAVVAPMNIAYSNHPVIVYILLGEIILYLFDIAVLQ